MTCQTCAKLRQTLYAGFHGPLAALQRRLQARAALDRPDTAPKRADASSGLEIDLRGKEKGKQKAPPRGGASGLSRSAVEAQLAFNRGWFQFHTRA
jgi:hypothetical protein